MTWQHFVALGDSLTEGVGDVVEGLESMSWADRVAQVLQPMHYTNLAKRGQTSDEVIATQLQTAFALQPDLVSVLMGGNDARKPDWKIEDFNTNLHVVLRALSYSGAQLITMTMVDISPLLPEWYLPKFEVLGGRIRAINESIRRISPQYGAICVDLETHPRVQQQATLSADYLHPNMLGYQRIAAEVVRQLEIHFVH
ncbi:MAG: SGNH/GDSL hydrolase family protein [Chitinophagaceae bacterium]|nr:SGNH/GDSL hydrolase family protein [Anaerolineae bacterium]